MLNYSTKDVKYNLSNLIAGFCRLFSWSIFPATILLTCKNKNRDQNICSCYL